MGTSQRHSPSVVGDPNWGQSSQAITQVAKDIVEGEDLKEVTHLTPKQIRRTKLIEIRIRRNISKAINRMVKASGGKDKVASGGSKTLGKRGISYGINLFNLFQEVSEKGLGSWLKEKGFNILNSDTREVLDFLYNYIHEDGSTLDDTAANDALRMLFKKLEKEANISKKTVEEILNSKMSDERIKMFIDEFFGNYIFSHLSQNFREKLEKKYGIKLTAEIRKEIRRTIIADVKEGVNGQPASKVDWKGVEAQEFINKEFSNILHILCGND